MSYQEDKLTAIANAIRTLKGTSGSITASDFASEINAYKTALNAVFPVGARIMKGSETGGVNPGTLIGGTWVAGGFLGDKLCTIIGNAPLKSLNLNPLTYNFI